MLNDVQRKFQTDTATRYANALSEKAVSYLEGRGITKEVSDTFLLGSVVDPAPGHEQAEGRISIPYITPAGVVGMKFRSIDDSTPKYLWPTGQRVGLFNVNDLHKPSSRIAICEGEIDTIVVSALVGICAVGVAGVSQWKDHFPKLFESYDQIFILADNDIKADGTNPGMELAKRIKEDLNSATVVHLPAGQDVNEVYLEYGPSWFHERLEV